MPVWAATWEFECCQPEAVVRHAWDAALFLHQPRPWWALADAAIEPAVCDLGVVELDVDVIRPAPHPDGAALLGVGAVRLGGVGMDLSAGSHHVRGRLVFEGHVGPDGVDLDEV